MEWPELMIFSFSSKEIQVVSEVNSMQGPKQHVWPNTEDITFMKTSSF